MQNIKVVTTVLGDVGTNCYIIVNEASKEIVIVDPAADSEYIKKIIAENEYSLKAILLTHAHFDHIGAVNGLKETYPLVPVYIGINDEALLGSTSMNLSAMFGRAFTVKADKTVSDKDELEYLGTTIKCIEIPGHTQGGMCYYFMDNKMIFDGDTLFAGSVGRSDFPTGDGDLLLKSIEEKLFTLPEDVIVYPGHNGKTKIGREKAGNMFF